MRNGFHYLNLRVIFCGTVTQVVPRIKIQSSENENFYHLVVPRLVRGFRADHSSKALIFLPLANFPKMPKREELLRSS